MKTEHIIIAVLACLILFFLVGGIFSPFDNDGGCFGYRGMMNRYGGWSFGTTIFNVFFLLLLILAAIGFSTWLLKYFFPHEDNVKNLKKEVNHAKIKTNH